MWLFIAAQSHIQKRYDAVASNRLGDLAAMAFARINLDAVPGSLDKLVRRLLPMRG